MTTKFNDTPMGNVSVDNEVIKNIALKAATDITGIYKPRKTWKKKLLHILTRRDIAGGVKLEFISENELKVSMKLTVGYGINIPHITGSAQENVKRAIEYMTGLTISEVSIKIIDMEMKEGGNLKIDFEESMESPIPATDNIEEIKDI